MTQAGLLLTETDFAKSPYIFDMRVEIQGLKLEIQSNWQLKEFHCLALSFVVTIHRQPLTEGSSQVLEHPLRCYFQLCLTSGTEADQAVTWSNLRKTCPRMSKVGAGGLQTLGAREKRSVNGLRQSMEPIVIENGPNLCRLLTPFAADLRQSRDVE